MHACTHSFSWVDNGVRVGAWVLILHDPADFMLELSKSLHYAKWKNTSEVVFTTFAITWIITRVILLPTIVLVRTRREPHASETNSSLYLEQYRMTYRGFLWIPLWPAYFFFNLLLVIIYLLQLYWTQFIIEIAYEFIVQGKIDDTRSDESEEDPADDTASKELASKQQLTKGSRRRAVQRE